MRLVLPGRPRRAPRLFVSKSKTFAGGFPRQASQDITTGSITASVQRLFTANLRQDDPDSKLDKQSFRRYV
jgi:hypothetical protein